MNKILQISAGVLFACSSVLCSGNANAHEEHGNFKTGPTFKAPTRAFIENKGQWDDGSRFRTDLPYGLMRLTDDGIIYNFLSEEDMISGNDAMEDGGKNLPVKGHTYLVNFVGANKNRSYEGKEKQAAYNNYFIGSDANKWANNVGKYGEVLQHDVYNNIDLKVYSTESKVKYDFIVKKGADPKLIQLAYKGVSPTVQKDGSLKIVTSVNEVIEQAPYTYQLINGKQVTVFSRYTLANGVLGFEFPNGYNKEVDLVIDPNLIFATYSGGGNGQNTAYYAHSTTYDNLGNTYAAALATGQNWPTTPGAFMTTFTTSYQVGINKYSVTGSNLLYSTYFATTTGATEPNTLRCTEQNELILAGSTNGQGYPATTGAFQSAIAGGSDIYVVKFNTTGTGLIASTLIGGTGVEAALMGGTTAQTTLGGAGGNPVDVALDDAGNIWVCSNTGSSNFPVTANAFQSTIAGSHDAVLVKMNPSLTSMIYGTFIGGSAWDGSTGMEFNKNNNTIGFVGRTSSTNFPIPAGAYHSTSLGGQDGFALLFNNASYQRVAGTFLTTSGTDLGMKIAYDCGDNVFVCGTTTGSYPVTATVAQGLVTNGGIFLQKLNPTLTTAIASIRTGASGALPTGMMVDICGNILVSTIYGSQAGMPVTPDAFDATPRSFYFAAYGANFSDLKFGSYYGFTGEHFHTGLSRMDPKGIVYQSVCATTTTFPTTAGSWSPIKQNGTTNDIITFKFDFEVIGLEADLVSGYGGYDDLAHAVRGCKSAFVKYSRGGDTTVPMILRFNFPMTAPNAAINGTDYQLVYDSIYFAPYQRVQTLEIKPLLVPNMPTGDRLVVIESMNPCGCDGGLTNVVRRDTVHILDSLRMDMNSPLPAYCPGDVATIIGDVDPGLAFHWTPSEYDLGNLTINPVLLTTRNYVLKVTQPGAPATCPPNTRTFHALVEQFPKIYSTSDTILCITDSVAIPLMAAPDSVNYTYQWSPGTGLRATDIGTNYFKMPPGTYNYTITVTTPIAQCSSTHNMTINVRPPFQFTSVTPPSGTIVDYLDQVAMSASGAILYTWLPTGAFVDPTLASPTTLPVTGPGTYYVTGIDQYGCKDTSEIILDVKYPYDPVMPNAFSPNGDGKNDVFSIPNGKFVRVQRFQVYDRWGRQVFSTQDGAKGWDGTDAKTGKPSEQGVYVYIVTIELPNKEIKSYKGDIQLMR